ncbi:hypothetical protein ACLESO_09365, partial [Pyxidicoccus sp. 3LG]
MLPALDALAGPVLLVDGARHVAALTPALEEKLGGTLRAGTPLAEVLVPHGGAERLDSLLTEDRRVVRPAHVGGRTARGAGACHEADGGTSGCSAGRCSLSLDSA